MSANYRPMALTSHIVKMFEIVVIRCLVSHLKKNNLLAEGQHGQSAPFTQLLAYWNKILDYLGECKGVDVVFTDFSKPRVKLGFPVLVLGAVQIIKYLSPIMSVFGLRN